MIEVYELAGERRRGRGGALAEIAAESKAGAQAQVSRPIATEVVPAATFWPAEDYHQQYLVKNGRATSGLS